VWLLCAAGASADPTEPDSAAPPITAPVPQDLSDAWRPPAPAADRKRAKDWVLLKSGELLYGTIEHIRDEEVYFDSDELEDLEIDWSDVAGFGSPRLNTYRFGDDAIVTGTAGMRGGVIRVDTGTEIREFSRAELYSMIEGETSELNYWSLDAGAGLTWRSGNADQTDFSSRAKLERETALTRGFVAWESAYSVVEDDEVTNNRRITGIFAYYLTTRFFLAAPIGELYTDRVRNIDLRATIAAGAGYDIVDRPRAEWSVLAGAGYQRAEYSSVATGEDDLSEDAALLFQTTLELDPYRDVDWDTTYTLVGVVSDWDKTSHHLTSVFSFEVWGPLDLDVSFVWDRIENPPEDPDGTAPESDDLQLTVGVSLEL
jgi:hypothetical protein